jgi:hypothetical protein
MCFNRPFYILQINQIGFLTHCNIVVGTATRNDGIVQLWQENRDLFHRTIAFLRVAEKAQYRAFINNAGANPPTANRFGTFLI